MTRFFAAIVALVAAASAQAVIVQGTELPQLTPVSNQLGIGYGVTFKSQNYPAVTFVDLMPGVPGMQGCDPSALPSNGGWYNDPIFVTFVNPADGVTPATVNSVTAMWGDGGGDFDAVDMRAFDLSNNLIASQTFTGNTFTQIQLSAIGIHRVEFWANTNVGAGTSDTGLDWISYEIVPAPATVLPFAAAALAFRRRR